MKDCEKNCREDVSILERRRIVQETFEEMREQIGMEGDWDEIGVTDTDNREFVLQDVIEQFYDLMIEKVLNYIGAE